MRDTTWKAEPRITLEYMFIPKPGTKQNAVKRWKLSDRIFFGHGACHILAHEFLMRFASSNFYPIWIKPDAGYRGNHVFVTNGAIAFDYRGYLTQSRLLSHFWNQYQQTYPGWNAQTIRVRGNLNDPKQMKAIEMHVRGPDDFLHNATPRAQNYLKKYDRLHEVYLSDRRNQ